MAKSAAFGIMHLGIAFGVGYALTGSLAIAGALTLVEPLVNTVAHYFFDRWWDRRARRHARNATGHQAEPGVVAFSSRVSQASA
ncbi:putative membrane protein [Burkholderiales bacterium JOSHI_001]|nr:putative membrane protein [Burkholderiales bacterium JOSHI_001]